MRTHVSTRIRRVVVLLATVAITTAAFAATAAADLEWQPTPTDLSPSDQAGQSPKVAALGDGDAVAIWAETPDCGCPFFGVNAATWDGATNTWSASTAIPDQTGPVLALPPFLADLAVAGSTDGTATAVWAAINDNGTEEEEDDFIDIQASVYDGSAWGSATTIGGSSFFGLFSFPNVDVAMDAGGNVFAVWTAASLLSTEIQAATYASGTWSSAAPISDDEDVDYARVASLGGGSAVVVWAGCGCSGALLESSHFDGSAWGTPVDIDPAGEDDPITPAIATTGSGTATATWIDFDVDTGLDVVRTATYAGTDTWSNQTTVSDPDDESASPDVTSIGTGAAAVVWVINPLGGGSVRAESVPDFFCGCPGIVQGSTSPGGDTWTTPVDLSDSTEANSPDVSGIGDGTAVAVWFTADDIDDETTEVQAATFDAATADAPRTLTAPGALGIFPQTAGTGALTAQTVWTGDGGTIGLSSTASLGAPEVLKVGTAGGTVTIATEPGGFLHMKNQAIPASPAPPAGVSFPYGMFSFDIVNLVPGASATVTMTLPAPATELWKLQHNAWILLPGTAFVGNTVTYTVVDGGLGDADGVPNGTIVDPAAPGLATVPGGSFTG